MNTSRSSLGLLFQSCWAARPALHIDLKPLPILPREERVRLCIADDLALGRIPLQFAAEPHGDVREMADLEHPVVRPDVRNRLLAGLHPFDEVRRVVLADLPTVDLLEGPFGKRLVLEILDRLAGDLPAVHEE